MKVITTVYYGNKPLIRIGISEPVTGSGTDRLRDRFESITAREVRDWVKRKEPVPAEITEGISALIPAPNSGPEDPFKFGPVVVNPDYTRRVKDYYESLPLPRVETNCLLALVESAEPGTGVRTVLPETVEFTNRIRNLVRDGQ